MDRKKSILGSVRAQIILSKEERYSEREISK